MKGVTSLLNNKIKIVGFTITSFALLLILIVKVASILLLHPIGSEKEYKMFVWLFISGLYIVAFTKEKIEDERVKNIRSRCLLIGFSVALLVLMISSLIMIIMPAVRDADPAFDLMLVAGAAIAVYLIFFYAGTNWDSIWNYDEKQRRIINIKGDKKYLFCFYAAVACIIILIALV